MLIHNGSAEKWFRNGYRWFYHLFDTPIVFSKIFDLYQDFLALFRTFCTQIK